jgi:hypothetical protein
VADEKKKRQNDSLWEGRDEMFMDIDRMVNVGLGGGWVSNQTGIIEDTTTDSMDEENEKGKNLKRP